MRRVLSLSLVFGFFLYFVAGTMVAQTSTGASNGTAGPSSAEPAVSLAESGRCAEALPLLKKTIRQTITGTAETHGLVGMHCA
jgi:hypothetical protein